MKREDTETTYKTFVLKVKAEGLVWASPSHSQSYPCTISYSAILPWEWDGELFAMTVLGKRVVCNEHMPAFHIYNLTEQEQAKYASDKTA